jgi:hypothetical protein
VLLRGEGTQSRVDIVVGGGIGVVGVAIMLLLDEEMVVIPKNYWKLDVVGGGVVVFIVEWVLRYYQ